MLLNYTGYILLLGSRLQERGSIYQVEKFIFWTIFWNLFRQDVKTWQHWSRSCTSNTCISTSSQEAIIL